MYPHESPRNHVQVASGKPAQVVQTIQGAYYVVAGLLVALFVESLQGPVHRPFTGEQHWLVRIIALIVAGVGVAFVLSGRRTGRPFVPAGLGMWVALALLAQSAAGMVFGVLPLTFLLDAALELGFVVWWVAIMFSRVDRQIDQSSGAAHARG